MRILFFSNVFPNAIAPTKGTFNLSLVQALAEQHDVQVVSPVSWVDQTLSRVIRAQRLAPEPVQLSDRITACFPTYYYPPKLFREQTGTFLDWSTRRVLDQAAREFRPDAVVSYWAHPDGEVAVRFARRLGVPAIAMVGGSDVLLLGRSGPRREVILKVLNEADAVVAVSRNIADCVIADGVAGDHVEVIPRGVDHQRFSPGDQRVARQKLGLPLDRPVLVAVGRLVPVKGFDILIQACRILADRGLRFACYILGTGPLAGTLARQIASLHLEKTVGLPGGQPQSALPDWYRAANLSVLSSLSEGIPNVLLEAMACGTPFVASDVGGVPEIADPRMHRLVPPRDPAALAHAIAERLSAPNPDGPPRFTPLTWAESADRLTQLIARCSPKEPTDRLEHNPAWDAPLVAGAAR